MTPKKTSGYAAAAPFRLPLKPFEMLTRTDTQGLSCLLCGVLGILVYSDTEMAFRTGAGRVSVCGSGLRCRTYVSGNAEVIGQIASVSFSEVRT